MHSPHDPIRIGIIGCGRAGAALHARALAALPDLRVCAVVDTDVERARAAAAVYDCDLALDDHRAMLASADIDAVAVCTPAAVHAHPTLDALAAGKHCYVEKPLALSLKDADAVVAAAEQADTACVVGHNLRCHRLVLAARELVAAEAFGELQFVRSVWTAGYNLGHAEAEWRRDPSRGGGVLFELSVHHMDLLRFILDDDICRVQALEDEGHGAATATLRMRSGLACNAAYSFQAADSNAFEIVGSDATLRFSLYAAGSFVVQPARQNGGIAARLSDAVGTVAKLPLLVRAWRSGGDFLESYTQAWRAFAATVRGEQAAACTPADGRAALAAVLAANQSVASGRVEAVTTGRNGA